MSRVCYLGHIFGMHPDPSKISYVQNWQIQTSASSLAFLNQACSGLQPVHTWLLEIALVHVLVCVYVSVHPQGN